MQAARAVSKAERTRSAILEAAAERFARSGFAGTRLDDIGADVGIAGSAILYHFEGKRALYHAVLDDLLAEFGREIEQALAASRPFVERFEGLISAVVRYVARRPAIAHIVLRESCTDDPELRAELQARARPLFALFLDLYEEGERTGELRPIRADPTHLVSAVAGTVVFYIAALPTFLPNLPESHLGPSEMQALERDVLQIARRLLGIPGARALRRRKETTR